MKEPKLLVIDAGHSRTKFSLFKNGEGTHFLIPNKPFNWPEEIKSIDNPCECLLIGTNQRQNIRILSHLKGMSSAIEPMVLGKDCRVPIDYDSSENTGSDRLAQAYGATLFYPNKSILMVSAGSALVIDYIDKQQTFKGGMIGLGLKNYRDAMQNINPLLVYEKSSENYPAKDTPGAVKCGWYTMVKSTLIELKNKLNPDVIICSGGDNNEIKKILPEINVIDNIGAYAMAHALQYIKIKAKLKSN